MQMVMFGLIGLMFARNGVFVAGLGMIDLVLVFLSLRAWMAIRKARSAASRPGSNLMTCPMGH